MRLILLALITFSLQSQESSAPTVDRLQARIAFLERTLQIYQQAAFNCQDARIDEQARRREGNK